MTTTSLLGIGAVYAANEFRKSYEALNHVLDRYPERLNDVVEKIKSSIDFKTYEFLTNRDNTDELDNPAIESYSQNGPTCVVTFRDIPDFVVKTSTLGLRLQLSDMGNERLFVETWRASNSEGAVTQDLFKFAKRVTVAKRLRKIIKQHHLDKIKIPKKYLCSFPSALVSRFETPFYNRHVFVLCERCDVDYIMLKTHEELKMMTASEMETLANQIHLFFLKSGILDFLPQNFYIKDGKMVIFDTEPMSLRLHHNLCVSPTLRAARVNFRNLERNFFEIPEAKILVDQANKSITQIRDIEKKRFQQAQQAIFITMIFLKLVLILNYLTRLPVQQSDEG